MPALLLCCPSLMLFRIASAFALSAIMVACSPLTALNAITPDAAERTVRGLPYDPLSRQKLDIYIPSKANMPAPVIVFFYGGNWNSGERADYAFVGEALASRGMLAIVADYRLYPEARYPQILQDAAAALAWTAREAPAYGGDPSRLFVMGHSAGAYNAAMLALDKRWLAEYGLTPQVLRGWIGLAGPYNFIPIQNPAVRPVFFYPDTPPASQPVNHVTAAAAPALLISPEKDEVVNPSRNTGQLAQAMRARSIQVEEFYFDSVSHPSLIASFAVPLRWLAPTLDTVAGFVFRHSKGVDTAAAPITNK